MEGYEHLIELREYCRKNKWPRLPQWQHWIYSKNKIAVECVKKIGGKYFINIEAFKNHIENATLD